jgi:DNA polymerase-3 subunit beta
MKFIVSSTGLFSHLQAISRVINSKNTLPILDCFLVELNDGTLSLTASDNETTLSTSIEVNEYDKDGRFAISSKTILDALKEIPEQPLTFDVNLETLEIMVQYQNGKYNLVGQNADEYPQAPALGDSATELSISASLLLSGINRAIFATADDELRPVMNGIYFDITPESITFVASDGHKLVKSMTFEAKGSDKAAFILPKKPANILKNLLPKESEDVRVSFDDRNAIFTMEKYYMVCRLIEGRYPNYNSVIPQGNPHRATIDRQMMISALRRVSVFSSQASSLIKLRFSENQVQVSAQDIDFSTSAEEALICQYTGANMNIGFKSTFLIDILSNMASQDVIFELADPSRAGVIVPAEQEKEKEDVLMLLMPMMLND